MTGNHEGWLHDYDNYADGSEAYYCDERDTSPIEWDIKTLPPNKEISANQLPADRKDFQDVENATTLSEAIKAYEFHYSWGAIHEGRQSPQQAAEMLHRINDKFNDSMTPEQCHGLAIETIAMGHAIGRLADRPVGEGVDRTTLKGLIELTYIISLAQVHAPDEIPLLEEDLQKVASKVEGRVVNEDSSSVEPLSGPILAAVEKFDSLSPAQRQSVKFYEIVEKLEHENLNQANNKAAKVHKIKERYRSRRNRSKSSADSTQFGAGTQTHFSTGIATMNNKLHGNLQ